MQSSQSRMFHGKVDCKDGVNEEALFAASLDAAFVLNGHESETVRRVKESISSVCDSIGLTPKEVPHSWNFGRGPNGSASVEMLDMEHSFTSWTWRKLKSAQTSIEDWSIDPDSPKAPRWVRDSLLKLFTVILKCETEDDGDVKHLSASLICVIGTLLLCAEMGITQLLYSPIPIESVSSNLAKHLLVNMDVCMVDNESCSAKSTPFGVALLRVLAGTSLSKDAMSPLDSSSQRHILRGVGTGTTAFLQTDSAVSIAIIEQVSNKKSFRKNDDASVNRENQRFLSHLWMQDTITHMETNLDDITGENLAFIIDLLLQHGAVDAWVTPIVMKKGRPAHTLHCLCREDESNGEADIKSTNLLELMFRHSTTLGIRIYKDMPRAKLCRSTVTVQTLYKETARQGFVDVKVSSFKNGEIISTKAEFDHCKAIALEAGIPLKFVSEQAVAAARKQLQEPRSA